MTMKLEYRRPIYILLAILLFFALLSISTLFAAISITWPKPTYMCMGCFEPIANTNSAEVLEMAKFAVKEHNKRSKSDLEFVSVISGESQITAGMNYRLVISVKEGGEMNKYEAYAWDQPWTKTRELASFEKIEG